MWKKCLDFSRLYWIFPSLVLWAALFENTGLQAQSGDFFSHRVTGLTNQEVADGWLALLVGDSWVGWRNQAPEIWKLSQGTVSASGSSTKLLRTAVQFDDFELRFDFQLGKGSVLDCLIRTSPDPQNTEADGCLIELVESEFREGQWFTLRLSARGGKLSAAVDGATIPLPDTAGMHVLRKGYIGFRIRQGNVQIRNVFLLPENMNSIFNGKDLAGWNTAQALDSRFAVVDGSIQINGGRGQLETKERFGDFFVSLHGRTNSSGLNSGVFFRCIPGELMNGYESQIQHQFKNNDRSQPVDCGTGGIFRRQNARWINSDDKSWFAMTIVADGATFCVWVNGLLVADWTDLRVANKNPRKGQRLQPGTMILQGHDPTTDLNFKNLKAREMNPRRID